MRNLIENTFYIVTKSFTNVSLVIVGILVFIGITLFMYKVFWGNMKDTKVCNRRALMYFKIKKRTRAIQILKQALERKIEIEERVNLMYNIGLYSFIEENYFDAFTYFELIRDISNLQPKFKAKYLYKIGDLYYRQGDFGKASVYFEEYLKLCIGIKSFFINRRSLYKILRTLVYGRHIEVARLYYIILRENKHCKRYKDIEKMLQV